MKEEDMIKELKKFKKDDLLAITIFVIQHSVPEDMQEGFLRRMLAIVESEN